MTDVFVFGSNREGRHGRGAARTAVLHHGALYRQAKGRQGNSYAIVTKELRPNQPPVTLEEVRKGVDEFLAYAEANPGTTFTLTPIGTGLAGFKVDQIEPLFAFAPANVRQPDWGKLRQR